jgi:hypothetical protein
MTFWAWQLLDPDQWEALPTDAGAEAINLVTGDYIDTVDVYRVYTDYSQHSAEFFWEPRYYGVVCPECSNAGCPACELTVQCGCMHVRDVHRGIVVPVPSEWDSTNEQYNPQAFELCVEPDQVKLWYYAGEIGQRYLNGSTCDPLDDQLARAIAYMATARLERQWCACNNVATLAADMRIDMIKGEPDGSSYFVSDKLRDNPFGTRKGEVYAWRILRKRTKKSSVAVI